MTERTALWFSIGLGLLAALFWMASALVRIPKILDTSFDGPDSLTATLVKQSRLSAIAAVLTAASIAAQAASALSR